MPNEAGWPSTRKAYSGSPPSKSGPSCGIRLSGPTSSPRPPRIARELVRGRRQVIPMIKIAFPVIFQGFTGFTCLLNMGNDEELAPAFDERILRTLETATLSLWRERSNLSSRSIFSYLGYRYCGWELGWGGGQCVAQTDQIKLHRRGAESTCEAISKPHVRVLFARCNSSHVLAICELLNGWWPGTESNRRRRPFQGRALPTELPGQREQKEA